MPLGSSGTIAIADDDDLQIIEDIVRPSRIMLNLYRNSTRSARMKDSLNGGAVRRVLLWKRIPMLVENGCTLFFTTARSAGGDKCYFRQS